MKSVFIYLRESIENDTIYQIRITNSPYQKNQMTSENGNVSFI